jgi:hypothetical protein
MYYSYVYFLLQKLKIKVEKVVLHKTNQTTKIELTTSWDFWPRCCPLGEELRFFLSSGRNDLDEKENRPSWLHTRECFTKKTSRMSPVVLANRGN